MILAQNAGWDEDDSDSEDEGTPSMRSPKTTTTSSSTKRKLAPEPDTTTANFTLEEMGPSFFWAVRNMVGNSALYAEKASDIADCVIDQVSVGTVVTQPLESGGGRKKKKKKKGEEYGINMETDADNRCIYAYSTILNLNDEETDKFIPDIVRKLREGSKGDKEFEDFLKLGKPKEGGEIGLLLSDAMINVPHSIVSSLFNCLVEDVEWARENAEGEGGKEKLLYRFGKVLVVSKIDGETEPIGDTGGRWKIPSLRRVEEEYVMTRSLFEPFEIKARVQGGGGGKVRYLVGGVEYGDFEVAVKNFGRAV